MKKKRKNDFIQLAVLVLLGLSVILSIILPQVTRQPKEPQILSVSIHPGYRQLALDEHPSGHGSGRR